MYALIDCNNFFVSCERAFDPRLAGVPVVVLSSNDGCIVSRSNEAKELGIPMGAPYFQYKKDLEKYGVTVRSSNFSLYSEMSRRVMNVVESESEHFEQYSVDEAFVHVPHRQEEKKIEWARSLREKILQWTGIPVSVGIASTKTRAKIAGDKAKKGDGVWVFPTNEEEIQKLLSSVDVAEVWGIGVAMSRKLRTFGIHTVEAFITQPEAWVRRIFGVHGVRKMLELQGVSCCTGHTEGGKHSIQSTRSFGKPVESYDELMESIAYHIAHAAEKMRRQGDACMYMSIFIRTKRHSKGPRYSNSAGVKLVVPSADTLELTRHARTLLGSIYQTGYVYGKTGVLLGDFVPLSHAEGATLFEDVREQKSMLMSVLDKVNARYGAGTLRSASEGTQHAWKVRKDLSSPRYVSVWGEIPVVKC